MSEIVETISKSDFKTICRLCLKEDQNMTCVYNFEVIDILKKLTSITIYIKDGLPNQICSRCESFIRMLLEFKQQCEKSDKLLWDICKYETNDIFDDSQKEKQKNADVKNKENISTEKTENIQDKIIKPEVTERNCQNDSLTSLQTIVYIKEEEDNVQNNQKGTQNRLPSIVHQTNEDHEDVSCEYKGSEKYYSDCSEKSNLSNDEEANTDEPLQKNDIVIFKVNSGRNSANVIKRKQLKSHIVLDSKKCDIDTLQCKLCNKTLISKRSLARHLETHSENRKIINTCTLCNKPFYDASKYNRHIHLHEGKSKYSCEICNKQFFELSTQALHMKTHKIKPISCDVCQKEFLIKLQLEIHKKKEHEKKEYFCPVCNKKFHKKYLLKKHEKTHNPEKPFMCVKCSANFKHERSLRIHMESIHTDNIPKEVCNICGKSVKKLRYHMVMHQKRERIYKCDKCDQAYYTGYSLNAHVKFKHSAEKPCLALCPICGKQCETIGYLNTHMQIHKTDRPYSCNECDKSFKLKLQLKRHQGTHTDIRPFVCSMCGRGFKDNSVLKKHILTHTGERPHVCNICHRAFAQRSVLKTHMKIH